MHDVLPKIDVAESLRDSILRRGATEPRHEPPLEACQLSRTMSGHSVLCSIDMFVAAGEVVALVGANGAGKSTLLRCLVGQLHPTSGEVRWFGVSPNGRPDRHRLIGFAGHESYLYPDLTVTENLLFSARMYGVQNAAKRVAELLAQIGLQTRANQVTGRMSKGMTQRLSVARAIVHEPSIVVFDEPFNGLDRDGRDWLEHQLVQLRKDGRAVCITSHDRELCIRIADRVLELRNGELLRKE
jgi:heme exporter protein A